MIRGVLLDLAGVLYSGEAPLPGAAEAVARLRGHGLPLRFLTNSTRTPKAKLLERLRGFDIALQPEELFTPAQAACDRLAAGGWAPHLLVHPDLEGEFTGCARDGPPALVLGDAGTGFSYEALNAAFRVLEGGAPFLALAANRVFLDADGKLSLDAGAFVAALEFASGTRAEVLGKPAPGYFRAAADSMGLDLAQLVMVGDDAETDVAGALAAGAGQAVLVRSGKYRAGDERRFDLAPSAVVDGVGGAVDWLLAQVRS